MNILITYPFHASTIQAGLGEGVSYFPEASRSKEMLDKAIEQANPEMIVVGNNPVISETLRQWRAKNPNKPLAVARRGSSLAAIDTKTAEKLGIDVLNTPGVNSPYVADYTIDKLNLKDGKKGKVTILGLGKVGYYVAMEALNQGHDVVLYSPSLVEDKNRDERLKSLGLYNCKCALTLEEAFQDADYVCGAANITTSGKHPSKEMIKAQHIHALSKNARVVSVSETELFAKDGLDALVERTKKDEISVCLDNSPRSMNAIRQSFPDLPDSFELRSEAMKSEACQKAMDKAVLAVCEAWHGREVLMPEVQRLLKERQAYIPKKQEKVTIVGAGIMGLITAYYLEKAGLDITIVDAEEDPRLEPEWSTLGATHVSNARHASATETTPHASAARKDILMKDMADGGWRLKNKDTYDADEKAWVEDFNALASAGWLHGLYTDDVIRINKEGLKLWKDMMLENPELFSNASVKTPVVRMFLDKAGFEKGKQQQSAVGSIKPMDQQMLYKRFPALKESLERGGVVGGVQVGGFCVNVKDLATKLLDYLEGKNVKFNWKQPVKEIHTNQEGKTDYLETEKGKIKSDHYVISAGVGAAKDILKGKKSNKQVQGVAGLWLSIPNPGVDFALKIHAHEPMGVVNCTPDGDRLLVSAGFGYIGKDKLPLEDKNMQAFFAQLESLTEKFFPAEYQQAKKAGTLNKRYCVRPMTAHGLGLMEISDAVDYGRTIITGGNNAGGFVQAPAIAKAVKDSLGGKDNPVYRLYHPERFKREGRD